MGIVNLVYQNLCLLIIFLTRDLEKLALKYMTLSSLDQVSFKPLEQQKETEQKESRTKGREERSEKGRKQPVPSSIVQTRAKSSWFLSPPRPEPRDPVSSSTARRDAKKLSVSFFSSRMQRCTTQFLLPPHAKTRRSSRFPSSSAVRRAARPPPVPSPSARRDARRYNRPSFFRHAQSCRKSCTIQFHFRLVQSCTQKLFWPRFAFFFWPPCTADLPEPRKPLSRADFNPSGATALSRAVFQSELSRFLAKPLLSRAAFEPRGARQTIRRT